MRNPGDKQLLYGWWLTHFCPLTAYGTLLTSDVTGTNSRVAMGGTNAFAVHNVSAGGWSPA